MPSPACNFLRAGSLGSEGTLRHGPYRQPISAGRTPADHPHAVGPGPVRYLPPCPRGGTDIRATFDRPGDGFRRQPPRPDAGIQEIYAALAIDEARNMLIFDDVLKALEEGRSPILLTERKNHLDQLAERFRKFTRHLVVLKGGMTARDRNEVMEHLAWIRASGERLVLATGRYLGEGFDDARLDTLFLALPVSWKGTLVQYAGRLHRQRPDKWEVRIYDYVDRNVPMLARMFEKRMKGYRALGYAKTSVEEPSRSGNLPQPRQQNTPARNRPSTHRRTRRAPAAPSPPVAGPAPSGESRTGNSLHPGELARLPFERVVRIV